MRKRASSTAITTVPAKTPMLMRWIVFSWSMLFVTRVPLRAGRESRRAAPRVGHGHQP